MRILGVDHSPLVAYCVLLEDDQFVLAFSVNMISSHPHHQQKFVKDFARMVRGMCVGAIYIENARFSQKMVRMQTLLVAATTITTYLVNVSTWRKEVLGTTKTTKKKTMAYVTQKLGWEPTVHHYADAACVALFNTRKEGE